MNVEKEIEKNYQKIKQYVLNNINSEYISKSSIINNIKGISLKDSILDKCLHKLNLNGLLSEAIHKRSDSEWQEDIYKVRAYEYIIKQLQNKQLDTKTKNYYINLICKSRFIINCLYSYNCLFNLKEQIKLFNNIDFTLFFNKRLRYYISFSDRFNVFFIIEKYQKHLSKENAQKLSEIINSAETYDINEFMMMGGCMFKSMQDKLFNCIIKNTYLMFSCLNIKIYKEVLSSFSRKKLDIFINTLVNILQKDKTFMDNYSDALSNLMYYLKTNNIKNNYRCNIDKLNGILMMNELTR